MNTKARIVLIIALVLLAGAALVAVTWAAPRNAPLAPGGAPTVVAYQGEVQVDDTPYTGNGYFKFAVVNVAGSTTYWSNDGTSTGGNEPTAAVQLAVSDGLFGVLLGDTTLGGMTQALTANVFSQPDRTLRVWFSSDNITFDRLTPDTRIAAVPYALQAQEAVDADTVDGLHASELETHYQNVVVVAKSGGDYTSVQAAINSITNAAADNAYLVWVAPGVYSETVTMKPYVHLQGAGQEATVISSTASSSGNWPPAQATLLLASNASLRDLTVGNSGTGDHNTALLATGGMTRTLVADVTARALGNGVNNLAIFLSGSGTGVTLQRVTALAENGSSINSGLTNFSGAAAVLHGGSYTSRGGTDAWAIFSAYTATLKAESVTALGENGSDSNQGLSNYNNSTAVLYGGDYTGRGGNQAGGAGAQLNSTITAYNVTALAENGSGDVGNYAMACYDSSTATLRGGVFIARGGVNNYALANEFNVTMDAEDVTALAENGSNTNNGFWNVNNAQATVRGSYFTGRGGTEAYGVYNAASGTVLEAESVTALGENSSINNFGLRNSDGAVATLRGGSFTASGGTSTYGIFSLDAATTLEADGVTALGKNSSGLNFGLENYDGGVAVLRGGSFTGRGGSGASGVQNTLSSTLTAEGITALAENGSAENHGLLSQQGVTTTLHGGSFTARGGEDTYGIYNGDSGTTLEADNVTVLGENGSHFNHGLFNNLDGVAVLRGGAFTGRGGTEASGICNRDSSTTLSAEGVSALGENGSSINRGMLNGNGATTTADSSQFTSSDGDGLYLGSGTVYLGVSQLDGGATNSSGTLTCFQVYDGSYSDYTCP